MKQVAQNYKSGEISLLDVPVPALKSGGVLVRTDYSLISMGTEAMKVHESKLSLVGKARARPDQVKKVMATLAQQGPMATYKKVMNRLDSYTPLGYSLAGVVVGVGPGADEFHVGQRVACGGNLYALHAEYNFVPKNLCVPIPDTVRSEHASFATVAAIAMQGFRQSEAKLGETAVVIGLGLLGQILVQILKSAGVNALGIDISEERCAMAEAAGAAACGVPGEASFTAMKSTLDTLSQGAGTDYVFLTAGGSSNQPVELAVELARDRARVVDIGKCKLDLPWKDYYEKELDVRFSRSYGPGRYDPNYEEGGIDYPIGYVRWTERRNMQCVIDLLAAGKLDFTPIVSDVVDFEDAVSVYEQINKGELKGLGVVFKYALEGQPVTEIERAKPIADKVVRVQRQVHDRVRLGVIGAGNYASTMLLPHLRSNASVDFVEVATRTSLSVANAQKKFKFDRVSTDHRTILDAADINAVLIATHHDSHARLTCEALRAGKAVFVEKPLAITPEQLDEVVRTIEETGNDRLMVGFNRRYAPLLEKLKKAWGGSGSAQMINYSVNTGPLEAGSWYAKADEQGTRFIGEGGHFIDTVSWWVGADPVEVFASSTPNDPDNLNATFHYPDGTVARIAYITTGDTKYPKETFEVFGDGRVAKLNNFSGTELWQGNKCKKSGGGGVDKGQSCEVAQFVDALKRAKAMPVAIDSLVATTAATFAAVKSANSRKLERVSEWRSDLDQEQEAQSGDA